ncbi:MAG: serine/threonine protein kinase [Pseudonocardia sp.]|nr:serine/threonine protein kinase [Pseudonocardia sp.]
MGGCYVLGPVVGIGSTAMVHRGRDLRDDHPVAIKLFHAGASLDELCRQRRETETLAALDHPGLVRLRDGGVEDGRAFVVTDLVEGLTLAERITDGALTPEQVRRLGAELAAALAHVHAAGVVHRDVKPANVLLGDGSRARLADFGIARALGSASITGEGTVVGTAAFLAPEQARGEQVGPPADVYALGLVLLEALTGRREYPGHMIESASARLHRRPEVPDGLPHGLSDRLRAMTADDPRHRPSAAAVAARFASGWSGSARSGSGEAPRRGGRHRRPPETRRRVVVPLAAAAFLVSVAGGVAFVVAGAGSTGVSPVATSATPPEQRP